MTQRACETAHFPLPIRDKQSNCYSMARKWLERGRCQTSRAQRGTRCPPHMVLYADTAACLSYHLLTTLLISYVFACGINNVYLEKSMCIIVFDLTVNFKAKDSIFFFFLFFFFNFQRRKLEIILKLLFPCLMNKF